MESATQELHRLTSYDTAWYDAVSALPVSEWAMPVDDPRLVTDAPFDDVQQLPWFYRRYAVRLPRVPLPPGLPAELLRTCLPAALRGIAVPHRVVVHDVAGMAPGVYRSGDLSAPARAGALRDELYWVCLEQALARDAAFVVIGATDVGALDDREYREAQLAAGLVEGRLHLLAYALGAGASGMTFIDSAVPGLLGEPLDPLLFTCVGVPDYAPAVGGGPGAATAVRRVQARVEDHPDSERPPWRR